VGGADGGSGSMGSRLRSYHDSRLTRGSIFVHFFEDIVPATLTIALHNSQEYDAVVDFASWLPPPDTGSLSELVTPST
jgi:hypothetical protein